jgi:hypothetical protein
MIALQCTDRRVMAQYLMDGVVVTLCKPKTKVTKGNRTWGPTKYSIRNMGHQACTTGRRGIHAVVDQIGQVPQ